VSFSLHSLETYFICQWYDFIFIGGYAPFLSLAARESSFTVAANTAKAGPGPGHYNISKAKVHL
jgi:hypothetical protein